MKNLRFSVSRNIRKRLAGEDTPSVETYRLNIAGSRLDRLSEFITPFVEIWHYRSGIKNVRIAKVVIFGDRPIQILGWILLFRMDIVLDTSVGYNISIWMYKVMSIPMD